VEPAAAWALSFFFGGGGQVYVRDYKTGAALIAADLAALILLPGFLAPLGWLAIGVVSSILATRQALAVNRHVTRRVLAQQEAGPDPATYRLLAAQSRANPHAAYEAAQMREAGVLPTVDPAAGPSTMGAVTERLRKLADLRGSGVLDAAEHRERKIEVLGSLAEEGPAHREDILHELLGLRAQGVVDDDDIRFVKEMGA
jgi:hypothetical protein